MEKVNIKNISSGIVIITAPDIGLRRELRPGRGVSVSLENYEELAADPGFSTLVAGHYLQIDGLNAEEKETIIETSPAFDVAAIKEMLDNLDITAFAKFIPTAAAAEKETVVKLAIEQGIVNPGFTALIKKYCGVDIIEAINLRHKLEE